MNCTPQELGDEFESLLGLHCANVARASIAATAERLKKGRSEECEASYSALMQVFNSLTARLSAAERDYGLLRELASDLERRAESAEAKLAEAQKDARRFAWLEKQARQKTAYDLFGNGGYWSLGLHSADNRLSFATAIDAAMQQGADK